MWYATCCSRQYVVGSEHHRIGVTQKAMSGATATWNSWRGWDLSSEPNLTGADLRRADLPRTDLSEADLAQAILVGAILTGADLSTASLTQEELEAATVDENTRLPADLNPPAHWGVKPDEQAKED